MYCPHCGATVNATDEFCQACGGRLLLSAAANNPAPAATEPTAAGEPMPDLSQMVGTNVVSTEPCAVPPAGGRRSNRTLLWIVIAIGVLVIICCLCGLALFLAVLLANTGAGSNFLPGNILPLAPYVK
jgi:hypothetical protein